MTERETVAALLDRLGESCAVAERCGTRPSLSPEEVRRLIAIARAGEALAEVVRRDVPHAERPEGCCPMHEALKALDEASR